MNWKDTLKKIGEIALMEAPLALQIAGLPPSLGPAVVGGILAAQSMPGKSNTEKAQIASEIARTVIQQTNKVLVSKGYPLLFDEAITDDMLAHGVKLTYDFTKVKAVAALGAMPNPVV